MRSLRLDEWERQEDESDKKCMQKCQCGRSETSSEKKKRERDVNQGCVWVKQLTRWLGTRALRTETAGKQKEREMLWEHGRTVKK